MATRLRPPDARSVVALLATRGRFDLLALRAIPSILAQSRLPDRILVVVDQTREELPDGVLAARTARLRSLCRGRSQLTVLRNRRTQSRASGAWNTGLDQLHRDQRQPDLVFVAILDDDDAWEPNHLASCLDAAVAGDLNMVASGLIRHSAADDAGHLHSIPSCLDAEELFVRGQHIQGSNLFVRLDLLLLAGCFDERLPSCTDRDLCLRLARLPELRFGSVQGHTVHHYADGRADRLTTPGSATKLEGLTRFLRKHSDAFPRDVVAAAEERASTLFGWQPTTSALTVTAVVPPAAPTEPLSFVVGFVTDSQVPGHVSGLMDDLLRLQAQPGCSSVLVVVVENGPLPEPDAQSLAGLVDCYKAKGLAIEWVSIERQRADWLQGLLVDSPDPTHNRLPIAVSRTILNTYVARAAVQCPGSVAWILDDDKRLSILVDRGDGTAEERLTPDIATLQAIRSSGVDVVIGPDTDAAPLPFVATLRTQLVDIDAALATIAKLGPDAPWPDRRSESVAERAAMADTYYDLSRHTEHLETPFLPSATVPGCSARDQLVMLAARVGRLLAGEAVTRPLFISAADLPAPAARSSVQRGGSTLFFDPAHLVLYPQTLARLGDHYLRRSDMLVSQLQRDQASLTLVMHPCIGVRHDRSQTVRANLSSDTLRQDLRGYALYRTANELMQRRPPGQRAVPLLAWSEEELRESVRLVRKYLGERVAALTLNAWRIYGLAGAIRDAARVLATDTSRPWDRASRAAMDQIVAEMNRIRVEFQPSAVVTFAGKVRSGISDHDIRGAFSSMDAVVSEYRATVGPGATATQTFSAAREARAHAVLARARPGMKFRLLGLGGEGVVFTNGSHVYKVLDLLKRRPNHDTAEFLRNIQARDTAPRHVPPLLTVEEQDGELVIAYPFEASEPYTGGYGPDLIALLRECKDAGFVCRNMHPKNLRVTTNGVRLIDFGADLRPFTDAGYRSMAERAWISWRWPHRKDIDVLMRRALTDKGLPELDGFERFWQAVCDDRPSATRIAADMVDPVVLASGARSVLDYGCGKKAMSAMRFARAGMKTVGFDPGLGVATRWLELAEHPENLSLTASRGDALAAGPFDAVVCTLVLCEQADGPDYERILGDLRDAVREGGTVVVTVCSPFATFGGPTPLHRHRAIPDGVTYEDCFAYEENGETGEGRAEFHRPLRRIERDLLRHGLRVVQRTENQTVDTLRFEPASDFLTLVCRPVEIAHGDRTVALVMKTCAMEAATIERQVEHLVRQLEAPRTFQERVLAIDARRDGFVRPHSSADWQALQQASVRMLRHGWIDRVWIGPEEGPAAAQVMRNWFGLDSVATHSVHGAPLAMPLSAFESCTADYVLQVDSDLLVGRADRDHDFLGDMIAEMEADEESVTAALNVPQAADRPFSAGDGQKAWRVETRGSLLHRARLLAARPLPNFLSGGAPSLSWHRALDEAVRGCGLRSLRGGRCSTWFVHPANSSKQHVSDWMLLVDLVEEGSLPATQIGHVDLHGGPRRWLRHRRCEVVVFVVTGRNVSPGRMRRCLDAVLAQEGNDWGAIVIDDGSAELSRDFLAMVLAPHRDRVTLLQPRERRGQLANTVLAVRQVCVDPETVIVTIDLDDTLLGRGVARRILSAHRNGADVTVGSMLRTDKHVAYPVTFEEPRLARGGNCWQHLRAFRKRLFDAIPDPELRLEGRYVDIAVDWAFMLPIVEMARKPEWIREPIYLYEPSGLGKGEQRAAREEQIRLLVARPSRSWARDLPRTTLLSGHAFAAAALMQPGILFVRHAERPSVAGLTEREKYDVSLTLRGRDDAMALGRQFGPTVRLASSPIPRAVETATALADGAGIESGSIVQVDELKQFVASDPEQFEAVKRRLGWTELMATWADGALPDGVLQPCEAVARHAIGVLLRVCGPVQVVAVTHDFVLIALLAALRGERVTAVPYLGGVFVNLQEAERFLGAGVHE